MLIDLSQYPESVRMGLEVFGYIGSAIVVASFAMTSVKKLRIINGIGAVMSVVYALLIWALPVALMNIVIAVLDFYQLWKMRQVSENFELVPATSDGAYFKWFVDRYHDELKAFDETMSFGKAQHVLYYMRDNEVAGILAYDDEENGRACIRIDFVIPKYRDYRIGNYFFAASNPYFKDSGIVEFVTQTKNPLHEAYLRRIHFRRTETGLWVKAFA